MIMAKCYRTGEEIPLKDGFFCGNPHTGEWVFVSIQADELPQDYNVAVSDLVKSEGSLVDWLAHISEKTWFKPKTFFHFMHTFRRENKIYGQL